MLGTHSALHPMPRNSLLLWAVLACQVPLWEKVVPVAGQVAVEEAAFDGQDDEGGDGEGGGPILLWLCRILRIRRV